MIELGLLELDQLGRAKVEQKIFAKFQYSPCRQVIRYWFWQIYTKTHWCKYITHANRI